MAELKRCPFCGGEARTHKHIDRKDLQHPIVYSVSCNICTATVGGLTEKRAIEAWNRRVESEDSNE